jgi:hypothetical protein
MIHATAIYRRVCRHYLSVAVLFWGSWLTLVLAETLMGSNSLLGVLFGLSLPLLVVFVTWSSLHLLLVLDLGHRVLNIAALGTAVLLAATLIVGVGLLASASLKQFLES